MGPEVGEVGSCCGYASEVIYVTKDSCSLPVELLCDEASDILAVSCCLKKAKMEASVLCSVVMRRVMKCADVLHSMARRV